VSVENTTHLKWSVVYGTQTVEEFPNLDEAVSAAKYASDAGSESYQYIEGPDGVVDPATVRALWDSLDEEESKTWRSQERVPNTHTVILQQQGSSSRAAVVEWAKSEEDAQAKAERWRARYGDRVDVRRLRR
jgi:hypothetical protein